MHMQEISSTIIYVQVIDMYLREWICGDEIRLMDRGVIGYAWGFHSMISQDAKIQHCMILGANVFRPENTNSECP
jgi:hypothetical protein